MSDKEAERALRELEKKLEELDREREEILGQIGRLRSGRPASEPERQSPGIAEDRAASPSSEPPSLFSADEGAQKASAPLSEAPSRAPAPSARPVTSASPVSERIALFRTLFRGREDLYALRWESSKTGKAGYQPVCKNDWIRGLCRRPQVKCAACPAREFVPLDERAIRRHLAGSDPSDRTGRPSRRDFVIGVYPLLSDETCWFLAADFDKQAWPSDIAAFRQAAASLGIPVAVERSRSGNGAHAWVFFSEAVPAATARRLGTVILTRALDLRPEVGLDSYDRLFPSQDVLPDGGFGNLIALPLQHRAAAGGNSLFIDHDLAPFPDQWSFLSSIRRLDRATAERIVEEAARKGNVIGIRLPVPDEDEEEPWRALPSRRVRTSDIPGPLPSEVTIVLGDMIYIEKERLPAALRMRLIRLASFQNPEFYKAQAMRLSTFGKPRIISCAEDFPSYIALPRGCLEDAVELLASLRIKAKVDDERFEGTPEPMEFKGALRPEQEQAVAALVGHNNGVLAAATAFGKTVVAAKMIAERGVNALILVHRRQLLDQWRAQLGEFLGLGASDIGTIGSGKRKPTRRIDVALIQSLCRKGVVDDVVADYGHLVVDECHHIPASSFEQVARRCKARYVLGLSATVARKDGHHPIIFMQCGPVRFRVGAKQGTEAQPFGHKVILRRTKFALPRTASEKPSIQEIYDLLMNDPARNELIFDDILRSVKQEKRSPVLITERREHLEMFAERFRPLVENVIVFKGGMGQKQRQALADRLAAVGDEKERLLIATGRYLGEGFDDARLDTLFLTLPISWKGTLAQYAGRLHRLHYNKREVRIYDYVDLKVPMLERMFRRRLGGYRMLGYEAEGMPKGPGKPNA